MAALTVAIIGASSDRKKFGNKSVRAHLAAGYQVFPIHPSEPTVEGLTAYKSIEDMPIQQVDRISIYLPPPIALKVLPSLAKIQVSEVWLNPGVESKEVLETAASLRLPIIAACSIVNLGLSPSQFPD